MKPYSKFYAAAFFVVSLLFPALNADAQTGWKWGAGGIGNVEGLYITTDVFSNSFAAGYTASIDSSSYGGHRVIDSGHKNQLIITKCDSLGNFLWAKGTQRSNAKPIGMTTDAEGNLYLYGWYDSAKCRIDTFTLVNPYPPSPWFYSMYFVAKITPNGDVLWVKNIAPGETTGLALIRDPGGIGIDNSGSIYLTGHFKNATITMGAFTLNNADVAGANYDVFIAKMDPTGNFIWAKNYGALRNEDSRYMCVAPDGKFYIFGSYIISTMIGTISLSDSNQYLAKFDSSGNPIWAKNVRVALAPTSIATDIYENIYITGSFTTNLVLGTDPLTTAGSQDVFVSKFDSTGNVLWARSAGGTHSDRPFSIAVDRYGNSWIGGTMGSGPGPGYTMNFSGHTVAVPPATSLTSDPMFIAEYDNCGKYITSITLISGGDDENAVAVDAGDNVFVTGDYTRDTLVLGLDTLRPYPSSENLFIGRYKYNHSTSFPTFARGAIQHVGVCETVATLNIDSLLTINYSDTGTVLYWSLAMAPLHGTAVVTYTYTTDGSPIVPVGLTYTHTPGYYGPDSFRVIVKECPGSTAFALTTIYVSVDSTPVVRHISGPDSVCPGHTIMLTDSVAGGTWSSVNTNATVSGIGVVTGITPGIDTIHYTVTNACGSADTFKPVYVIVDSCPTLNAVVPYNGPVNLSVYPNPNLGSFSIELRTGTTEQVSYLLTDIIGKKIMEYQSITNHPAPVQLNAPAGIYFLNASTKSGRWNEKILVVGPGQR